jgi:hypothetical protein
MQVLRLSNQQTDFLSKNYSELSYNHIKNMIVGVLSFDLKYKDKEQIKDNYKIEIDLNQVSNLGMPIVREINGKILRIAEKKGAHFGSLHLNNTGGEMCMILPPKVKEKYPNGFDLKILLEHIEEHLYWISYFGKYDKKPWKEYGHGDLGYYELYLEDKKKYSAVFKDYFNCKSRPEFRNTIKFLRKKYKK